MTGATLDVSPCHYLYAYPVILSALSVILSVLSVILSVSEESDKHFLADNKSIISYTQILHFVQDDKTVSFYQILHFACGSVQDDKRVTSFRMTM